ncbi:MAG: hypothetical protein ACOCT8_02350 [Actinomycetota bacterium]
MTDALRRFEHGLPDELLHLDTGQLVSELDRPTLIRVAGDGGQPPRAITTLLHGDESTGIEAVVRLLRQRRRRPFDLYVVLGNVRAAAAPPGFAHRYLDGQEDLNRIFDGAPATTPEREAATAIVEELLAAGVGSLVDVHNNTGDNPVYSVVTNQRPETIALATLLAPTVLRFELRLGTLLDALEGRIPSCALECGLPGRRGSLAAALDALERYLAVDEPTAVPPHSDTAVLGGLKRVTVRDDARLRFGGRLDDGVDLVLPADSDQHNFTQVPAGHLLGHVHPTGPLPLTVTDAQGREVTHEHLRRDGEQLRLRHAAVPVMMTRTEVAARRDCLCYLAEPLAGVSPRGGTPSEGSH